MMHMLALACLVTSSAALRKRKASKGASSSWKTRTDSSRGTCSAHVAKADLPITFPLYCTGTATDLKFTAEARGHTSPRLRMSVDGEGKGYRTFPVFPATRSWTTSHARLTKGLHIIHYTGDRLDMSWLEITGSGASCSLEDVPGYSPGAPTNVGLDIITRVVGSTGGNFSDAQKRQLYFAHEVLGSNADRSISSTVISDGMYEWMYEYSRDQAPGDPWLSYKTIKGGMYEESDLKPYLRVKLDQLPGRSGQDMEVCEPCNTISNIRFHEAATWTACKGYPFTRDESATLMAGFSMTGAGSLFFHASATSAGHLADVYAMDMLMLQVHQIMGSRIIERAGSALTSTDRTNIMHLGKNFPLATEKAKELTSLFRQPYDRDNIWKQLSDRPPNYVLSIVTIVLTVVQSMDGRWPLPGLGALMNAIFDTVLDQLGGGDIEWVKSTYLPTIKKAFKTVSYCGDRTDLVGGMLNFAFTFLEAFVFQEELIPVPGWVREVVKFLAKPGFSTDGISDMKDTWDVFNGQAKMCSNRSPHSTWHEKAAHGLLHISNVAKLIVNDVRTTC